LRAGGGGRRRRARVNFPKSPEVEEDVRLVITGVLVAIAAALLAACGGSEGTHLTIAVQNGEGKQQIYRLRCEPPAGSVARPADLCRLIERNQDAMLHPPDLGRVCVGGVLAPYVKIKGRYQGEGVDTVVSACYGHVEGEALWLKLLPRPSRMVNP
jgi:hypothetical protein